MLSFDERVEFYIGKHLFESSYVSNDIKSQCELITNTNEDTLSKNIREFYFIPLKKLLSKTKNNDKLCRFFLGDIRHCENIVTFLKNRFTDCEDGVLLRCLNFERHWEYFYNKPIDIPFEDKENTIFWRGAPTGFPDRKGNRFDLVTNWYNKNDKINVAFVITEMVLKNVESTKWIQYDKPVCDYSHFLKHKYILSLEGNDKDSGLNWKLNSNSLILMPKPGVTSWLMETTLIPNYHYVLIQDDFSDLEEKLIWCNTNQEKCKEIIGNANEFMAQFSNNDMEEKLEEAVILKYFEIMDAPDKNDSMVESTNDC